MKNLGLGLAAMLLSASAFALPISFTANYSVDALDSDPGLVIETANVAANPFSFTLDHVGDWHVLNLFKIWTNETTVNADDQVAAPIAVNFNFTSPTNFGGQALGSTRGYSALFGLIQGGIVDWEPGFFSLSFGNGGSLGIFLEDETFNTGLAGLREGREFGSKVYAKFKLLSAPTDVPEPASLLLLGLGLVGLGVARRRRLVA